MDKKEWEKIYGILDSIHSDFLNSYPIYKDGKNQKIRDKAERSVDNAINLAELHIEKNKEVYDLLTGGEKANNTDRAYSYDDFRQTRYIGGRMNTLLEKIRDKINSL